MADQAQKTPIARTLEQFANRKIQSALDLLGTSLPASVLSVHGSGIVTVKFELTNVPFTLPSIKVPVAGSEYVRLPIQVGMKGWVMSADAYLGGMSGLGGGTADLTPRPNLSNLVWSPIGNTAWDAPIDANSLQLQGPDGVILRNENGTECRLTLTSSGLVISIGGVELFSLSTSALQLGVPIETIGGGTYAADLKTTGNVIAGVGGADQVGLKTHTHGGVQTGGGNTAAPNAGT